MSKLKFKVGDYIIQDGYTYVYEVIHTYPSNINGEYKLLNLTLGEQFFCEKGIAEEDTKICDYMKSPLWKVMNE
jgi:hypothetical protein